MRERKAKVQRRFMLSYTSSFLPGAAAVGVKIRLKQRRREEQNKMRSRGRRIKAAAATKGSTETEGCAVAKTRADHGAFKLAFRL